jgi:hypothetical protein
LEALGGGEEVIWGNAVEEKPGGDFLGCFDPLLLKFIYSI